ncbi:uncharacterized protein LOC107768843 [Nicotiana tabacum]|uniref:Uncharacterized protein LOC107768843 n=1 Tax=Nicotiana tabacum TaxID=4097 RepID=A0AC58S4J6_TOBAC
MSFKDLAEAKRVVGYYAVANRKGLKVKKSEKSRVRYKCDIGCPFVCFISKDNRDQGFKIKTLNIKHECGPAFQNRRATPNALAHYFKNKVQNNPKYKVKDMRVDLEDRFRLNVSYSKMNRVKRMVLEKLEGGYIDDYNRLEAYAQELRDSNPGTDVEEGKRIFLRMYICFQALKSGWKARLRPLIGLDSTFLKGKCKGILLVAMAQDSAKHFYPLAWAVVDRETGRTWKWFLGLLRSSLELGDDEGVTFISYKKKGLIDVVATLVPKSHHRWCVRHIEANWRGVEMKMLLWWCAWSSYDEEFKDQLRTLETISEQAAKDLIWYPPQNWCRAYFDTTCKNQMVDNNFTESFNK